MAGLTLDTGALIAADRDDRRFWAFWREALTRDADMTVPAVVVAQAWRGSRHARMARVISSCAVEPLDEPLARDVGLLCSAAEVTDIVDAAIVLGASRRGDEILTSAAGDLRAIATHSPLPVRVLDLTDLRPL